MSDHVIFRHGDATAIPFPDASFDIAWTQQAAMNIADKGRFYTEIHRVLRPEGRYAFQEVLAGAAQPIHFPVPWAAEPTLSFLSPADEMRSGLRAVGLAEVVWVDMTEEAVAFAREREPRQRSSRGCRRLASISSRVPICRRRRQARIGTSSSGGRGWHTMSSSVSDDLFANRATKPAPGVSWLGPSS